MDDEDDNNNNNSQDNQSDLELIVDNNIEDSYQN